MSNTYAPARRLRYGGGLGERSPSWRCSLSSASGCRVGDRRVVGFLASGHLARGPLSQMGRVLVRILRARIGDPSRRGREGSRHAWRDRSSSTGSSAFLVARRSSRRRLRSSRMFRGSFSEPGRRDRRGRRCAIFGHSSLRLQRRGRLVLGRVGSKLVAAEERHSVIVLGPTQSMKTTGFAIPAILEWEGPVLATSVKSDLLRDTMAAREQSAGEVWVYDPTSSTGIGAQRVVAARDRATTGAGHNGPRPGSPARHRADRSGLSDAEFWYQASAKLLAPLLFAAARSDRTIADVVRWVNLQEEDEVLKALQQAGVQEATRCGAWLLQAREQRQKSSIYTTAETVLAAYEDPVVAESAERSRHHARRPSSTAARDDALRGCAVARATETASAVRDTAAHGHLPRVRARRPEADATRSTASGGARRGRQHRAASRPRHARVDRSEPRHPAREHLPGPRADHRPATGERAQTVVNNHRAKIFLSGISDTQTLEYASRLLGDEEVMQSSVTRDAQGSRRRPSRRRCGASLRPTCSAAIRPGEGVLVYGHLPPARLRLRPWFKEKLLEAVQRDEASCRRRCDPRSAFSCRSSFMGAFARRSRRRQPSPSDVRSARDPVRSASGLSSRRRDLRGSGLDACSPRSTRSRPASAPGAPSHRAGAQGPMQFMPSTLTRYATRWRRRRA